MATADLDPFERQKTERQKRLQAGLRSADPMARYQAKDQIMHDMTKAASRALVEKAERTGRAFIEQQLYYDYLDRHPYKYKTEKPF